MASSTSLMLILTLLLSPCLGTSAITAHISTSTSFLISCYQGTSSAPLSPFISRSLYSPSCSFSPLPACPHYPPPTPVLGTPSISPPPPTATTSLSPLAYPMTTLITPCHPLALPPVQPSRPVNCLQFPRSSASVLRHCELLGPSPRLRYLPL